MITATEHTVQGHTLRRCPRCEAWLHDRVPRAWWVKTFLFFLPLKRYICYKCNRKMYLWTRDGP